MCSTKPHPVVRMPGDKSALNVWVELTEACQYKCRFCYNYWRDLSPFHHRDMPPTVVSDLAAFLSRASRAGFSVDLALAGGDPTAHPDFGEIVQLLAAQVEEVCVVTHGGNLTAELLMKLGRNENISFQFSIPSLDQETYRYLTGGKKLDPVVDALAICEILSIPVSISVVLTSKNRQDVKEICHLSAEVAARYLLVNQFLPAGRGDYYANSLALDQTSFDKAVLEVAQVASSRGVRLMASTVNPLIRTKKATNPKVTVGIDGRIRVCSLSEEALAKLSDPIEYILQSSRRFWTSGAFLKKCACSQSSVE